MGGGDAEAGGAEEFDGFYIGGCGLGDGKVEGELRVLIDA